MSIGPPFLMYLILVALDTPWDEPTKKSYEYSRYLTGQIFDEDPWNRLGRDVLGE